MTNKAQVIEGLNQKILIKTTHVTAAGGAATAPVQEFVYGKYLTTNGIWLLSYAEWFAVLSATWMLICILKAVGPIVAKGLRYLFKWALTYGDG